MLLRKKKCCLLVTFLLAGLTMGLVLPSMAGSKGLVSILSTRTVDGDPDDWTGINKVANSWNISNGEGIWKDAAFDDTFNGTLIYPNATMGPPGSDGLGIVPDSAGAPWEALPDRYAFHITDKFGGVRPDDPWYKHGGMVDLSEFRITADDSYLYMMVRFENMGSQAIACDWNYYAHNATINPVANETNYGKIIVQVFIDEDQVYGSGRTNTTRNGNFLISNASAWEALVTIAGDTNRPGSRCPDVVLANGTRIMLNTSTYSYGDCDIYPSCIEIKVPFSAVGDPRGETWRFTVVAGAMDEGNYRQVVNTTLAKAMGWPTNYAFCGGEGDFTWLNGMGNDPNIIDMAFTPNQTAQEAILNNFTKLPGTGLAVIKAYQDIEFDAEGNVIPWTPLLAIPIAVIALVIARKKLKLPKTEHQ